MLRRIQSVGVDIEKYVTFPFYKDLLNRLRTRTYSLKEDQLSAISTQIQVIQVWNHQFILLFNFMNVSNIFSIIAGRHQEQILTHLAPGKKRGSKFWRWYICNS